MKETSHVRKLCPRLSICKYPKRYADQSVPILKSDWLIFKIKFKNAAIAWSLSHKWRTDSLPQPYHRPCFKCKNCGKALEAGSETENEKEIYCKGEWDFYLQYDSPFRLTRIRVQNLTSRIVMRVLKFDLSKLNSFQVGVNSPIPIDSNLAETIPWIVF